MLPVVPVMRGVRIDRVIIKSLEADRRFGDAW